MTNRDQAAIDAANKLNDCLEDGTIMSAPDAARLVGYTRQGILAMIDRGVVTDISVGKAHFVLVSEVQKWVDEYLPDDAKD
jgi:hypothetical protein